MRFFRFLVIIGFVAFFSSCKSSSKLFSYGEVGSEAFDKTVPFSKTRGLMIVPVQINGETYQFLFDTGAPMVISEELQEKLQCKKLSKKSVGDSQGRNKKLAYVAMPTLNISGQSFSKLTAVVADLKGAPAIACLKIDGIIGGNLMRLAYWEIDYEADLMRFTNVWKNLKVDSTANRIDFYVKSSGTPLIPEIYIDSTRIKNVTFDTGSAGILGLSKQNLPKLKLDSTVKSAYGHLSSGLYGSSVDTNFYFQKSFVLGGDTIEDFPFEVQSKRRNKLLGMRYFKNYRMVFNWDSNMVYMHKKQPVDVSDFKSFGVTFILKDDYFLIGSIHKNSKAQQVGLALGDTVVRVNQTISPTTNADDYCQILTEMKEGETLEFEVKEKGVFRLEKKPVYVVPVKN